MQLKYTLVSPHSNWRGCLWSYVLAHLAQRIVVQASSSFSGHFLGQKLATFGNSSIHTALLWQFPQYKLQTPLSSLQSLIQMASSRYVDILDFGFFYLCNSLLHAFLSLWILTYSICSPFSYSLILVGIMFVTEEEQNSSFERKYLLAKTNSSLYLFVCENMQSFIFWDRCVNRKNVFHNHSRCKDALMDLT